MNMVFLSVLFLLCCLLCGSSAADSVPAYEYQDPSTKETLTCDKCPPAVMCLPCKSGHFTELWNYLPRCLYCSNFCIGNLEVETECSPTTNRVCRCKDGFYWDEDFCVRHAECGPGHGVRVKGTQQTKTVCEKCPEGYFSSSSSAVDLCVKHQECVSGESVLLPGSDMVCGTCESLANEDETLRRFLAGFFHMHRMRVGKMRKFVSRHISVSEENRRCNLPKQRGPLLDHIADWLAQAPEEHLRNLPQMLKDSDLKAMAEKLRKRLHEIQQQVPEIIPETLCAFQRKLTRMTAISEQLMSKEVQECISGTSADYCGLNIHGFDEYEQAVLKAERRLHI